MTLATEADVRRHLHNDSIPDAEITPFLQSAGEWFESKAGRDFDGVGSTVETFWMRRGGEYIKLKDIAPTVTKVKVFGGPLSSGNELTLDEGYVVEDMGRIRLRYQKFYEPFEGAAASTQQPMYDRVEVTYTRSGVVPPTVREGVAALAAMRYFQSARDASGFSSETLGSYSYSFDTNSKSKGALPDATKQALVIWKNRRVRTA